MFSLLLFVFPVIGEEVSIDKVDFKSIKSVLKNDRLDNVVKSKKKKRNLKKMKEKARNKARFNIPAEEVFWSFYSELWMVRNATILKWNFEKPDYGLAKTFKGFLEKQGLYEIDFKILVVNSPDVYHFALPSNPNELIFIVGLPFIRAMDLSRLEISLLLFEDYLRIKQGYFKNYAKVKGLDKFFGSNFKNKDFDFKMLKELDKRYDNMIFDKGFSFSQQYRVTKDMSNILKSDMKIWNTYYLLLKKKHELVTLNILFKKYLKIYPSPELQLNWMNPVKKKIL
jgi:hypothetical protein